MVLTARNPNRAPSIGRTISHIQYHLFPLPGLAPAVFDAKAKATGRILLNESLNHRKRPKPAVIATSVTVSLVSLSNCLASSNWQVCRYCTEDTSYASVKARRRWRLEHPNRQANASLRQYVSNDLSASIAQYRVASMGAALGASSERHIRHGRNSARSSAAAAAVMKKIAIVRFGSSGPAHRSAICRRSDSDEKNHRIWHLKPWMRRIAPGFHRVT